MEYLSRNGYYIHISSFVLFLSTIGILFFVFPKKETSVVENRNLAQFPKFIDSSLFNGSYMKDIDLYVADNFPLREDLVKFSFLLSDIRGLQRNDEAFYEAVDVAVEIDEEEDQELIEDTTTVLDPDETFEDERGERNDGILFADDQAMQIFGGNNNMAAAYAKSINMYRSALADDIQIYACVVPTATDFYLPDRYAHLRGREKVNLEHICSSMDPGIICVDAYSNLEAHKDEYLFFRSDHHWTGLGAYYAYSSLCETMGIQPPQLSQMTRKVRKNFLGSLYQLTLNQQLRENPDSVEYWKIPNHYSVELYTRTNQYDAVPGHLYAEWAGGASSYLVFLGGDKSMMVIESDNKNGKVAMVVKNSYGNPFATYFPYNFERTIVIDYRYFNRGVIPVMEYYDVDQLVFLSGSLSANTPYHINRLRKVMYATEGFPLIDPPEDTLATDSTSIIDSIANIVVDPASTDSSVKSEDSTGVIEVGNTEIQDTSKAKSDSSEAGPTIIVEEPDTMKENEED